MTKKTIIKIAIISAIFLVAGLITMMTGADFSSAQSCPQNTVAQETQATLVGEITDDGGDPNLEVWFDYGKSQAYIHQTGHFSKYGLGLFCATVYSLESCATYHYRAVAKNSVGTSYGENKTFTTKCNPVSVDLKVNGSDGPVSVPYNTAANISWTSANAASCSASGAWSGSKSTSGSESTGILTSSRTYTLTCAGSGGSASDSVTVNVDSPPTVDLKVNGSDGPVSVPYNTAANISWTSANATACTASNGWSGAKGTFGSESTGNLTFSRTYTLTCAGPGGSASDSVTVNVNAAPPTVDLKVNNSDGPITVTYGGYVNLSWMSQNVASCEASGDWSGHKISFGAETFYLNSVKTYVFTITCKDASQTQTTSDSVQVIAKPKPPVVITKPAIITM